MNQQFEVIHPTTGQVLGMYVCSSGEEAIEMYLAARKRKYQGPFLTQAMTARMEGAPMDLPTLADRIAFLEDRASDL